MKGCRARPGLDLGPGPHRRCRYRYPLLRRRHRCRRHPHRRPLLPHLRPWHLPLPAHLPPRRNLLRAVSRQLCGEGWVFSLLPFS